MPQQLPNRASIETTLHQVSGERKLKRVAGGERHDSVSPQHLVLAEGGAIQARCKQPEKRFQVLMTAHCVDGACRWPEQCAEPPAIHRLGAPRNPTDLYDPWLGPSATATSPPNLCRRHRDASIPSLPRPDPANAAGLGCGGEHQMPEQAHDSGRKSPTLPNPQPTLRCADMRSHCSQVCVGLTRTSHAVRQRQQLKN